MNSAVLDLISKGKEVATGRISSIQRVDKERVLVQLTDKTRIYLFLNEENAKRMEKRLLETAVFVGIRKLGVLEADIVIFSKQENHAMC
jgi:transcriptional regulator